MFVWREVCRQVCGHGAGYRVQGTGCRVQGAGYKGQGTGCGVTLARRMQRRQRQRQGQRQRQRLCSESTLTVRVGGAVRGLGAKWSDMVHGG